MDNHAGETAAAKLDVITNLICNVDEKTGLEWIKRFNAEGIDGLADRPRSGAPRCIAKEEMIAHVIPLLDDPGRANEEHCNTDVFQVFLNTLAQEYPKKEGIRQLLIMDNASWHKAKSLCWHHFEAKYLPPYSPDFNPIERFWLRIKNDFFSDFFCRKGADLEARILTALRHFLQEPTLVASQCRISENF